MGVVSGVLLTGAVCAGKTTVARELGELLRRSGVRHAVIDLDVFGEVSPPAGGRFNSSLIAANLRSVWPNYEAHGIDYVVLARLLSGADELAGYRAALPGVDLRVCRVTAPAAVLRDRVDRREQGVKRPFLLRLIEELDDQESATVENFTVDNAEHRSITNVALDVLAHLDWPTPA